MGNSVKLTWHTEKRRLGDLIEWDKNPRQLKDHDAEHLKKSLDNFGVADPLIINTDNRIIGGHMRRRIMLQSGYKPDDLVDVRVPERELTEREAEELAIRLNKNTGDWDFDALANNFELDDLLDWGFDEKDLDLDLWTPEPVEPNETEEDDDFIYRVPDAVWGTDNDLGIPLLDIKMQATALEAPFMAWGTRSRKTRMTGTYHFYVSDDRFEALWRDPLDVANSACNALVEVNFSVYDDMPRAVAIWQMYRKRWLSRWFQTVGIPIIVDLNISHRHDDLRFIGVPKGWKAYATRAYSERLDETVKEYKQAVEHAGGETILFACYGGGKAAEALSKEHGWIWYPDQQTAMREAGNG